MTQSMGTCGRSQESHPSGLLRPFVVALAALGALAATGRTAASQDCRLPRPDTPWHRAASEHFTVLGDSPSVASSACMHLERTLRAITSVSGLGLDGGPPVSVIVLRSGRTFDALISAMAPESPLGYASLYYASGYERVIVASAGVDVPLEACLAHELAHALVRGTMPRPPYWLDEGLAELYETIGFRGSKVNVGIAAQEHVYRLRKRAWLPFDELLALSGDPDWNEVAGRRAPLASEAWALVHYLLLGSPTRAPQLTRFLAAVQRGSTAAAAFGAAFDVTPTALQSEVLAFLQQRSHPFRSYRLEDRASSGCAVATAVAHAEALAEVGRVLAHAERPPCTAAECYLNEAVRLEPARASAWALLGLASARTGRSAIAAERFAEAERAGMRDAEAKTLIAEHILGRLGEGDPADRAPAPEAVARARDLLRTAADATPHAGRALHAYAASFLLADGDVSPGLAAIERVLQASPRSAEALRDYALLSAGAGRHEIAIAVIAQRLEPLDPTLARQARAGVIAIERQSAENLLRGGDAVGAAALLRQALALAEDEPTRNLLLDLLALAERAER